MLNQILNLSKKLISIPSTKENPKELKKVLEVALKEVKEYKIERFEKDNIPSALVYNSKTRPKKFKIILNAHLDVVPGKSDQYRQVEKDGKLYARGSSDMKSAAAVEILVFKELAKKLKYPVALQLVTDEEIGGTAGTRYQMESGVRADFGIAGEGSDLQIRNEAKGVIWAKIKTVGKTAHGAYPWRGENAIWKMKKFLDVLENKYSVPKKPVWKTTVNLSSMETTNQTFNKVPDDCLIKIDVRYIPKEREIILKKIKELLPAGFTIEIIENEPFQFTPKNNKFIKILQNAGEKIVGKKLGFIIMHGASDIRHFNRVGCDGIEFGPVGYGLHSNNEWVDIKSLEQYYLILKEFLLSIE